MLLGPGPSTPGAALWGPAAGCSLTSSAPRWMAVPKGRARSPRWSLLWLGSPLHSTGRTTQGLDTGCADLGKQRGSSRPQQPSGNGLCLQETPRTPQPWAMVSQHPRQSPGVLLLLSGSCPGPTPCTLPILSDWWPVALPQVKAARCGMRNGLQHPPGPRRCGREAGHRPAPQQRALLGVVRAEGVWALSTASVMLCH